MNGNTYYNYKKRQGQSHRVLELTSVDDLDNGNLKLEVMDSLNRPGRATITLTEQEQDQLIAEILKRRGIIVSMSDPKWWWLHIKDTTEPISSTPKTEQS